MIDCLDIKKDYGMEGHKFSQTPGAMCLDFDGIILDSQEENPRGHINVMVYRCQDTIEDLNAGLGKCKNNIDLK